MMRPGWFLPIRALGWEPGPGARAPALAWPGGPWGGDFHGMEHECIWAADILQIVACAASPPPPAKAAFRQGSSCRGGAKKHGGGAKDSLPPPALVPGLDSQLPRLRRP